MYDNFRVSGLVLPVLQELGPEHCVVLCGSSQMVSKMPAGTRAVSWSQATRFDVPAWRADYRKGRRPWQQRLRQLCRKHQLPTGVSERLDFHLLVASQDVAGAMQLLRAARPAAVVTEFDRNSNWSSLVLSARALGIPTFTMVHGVLNERALGYVPVLADKVFCWGEMQRRQFLAEGESPEKLLVTGCPRLTRDLAMTPADARTKLGLASGKPVVMLGTTPISDRQCREMAEVFCLAADRLQDISAVVRLHPSERLSTYAPVACRHPDVRFLKNSDATLEEALAAADIVVVPNSGFGSDALLKRRLTIVLALPGLPLGHGSDLIQKADCPCATNAEQLTTAIQDLLSNDEQRRRHFAAAERYIEDFCAFFGQESARRIAAIVREHLPQTSPSLVRTVPT
jgi:glycosyltransferase involved in cell wall biosynthesis